MFVDAFMHRHTTVHFFVRRRSTSCHLLLLHAKDHSTRLHAQSCLALSPPRVRPVVQSPSSSWTTESVYLSVNTQATLLAGPILSATLWICGNELELEEDQ